MLFNSYEFIFLFVPLTLLGFWGARRLAGLRLAIAWTVLASLAFYAWWNPLYIPLLVGSTLLNFQLGRWLATATRSRKALLVTGLVWNIGLLAYFKYYDFFVSNLNDVTGLELPLLHIAVPLAMSFFTFQKIAYLVDVYRGEVAVTRLDDFLFFVTFFPQLITGPIIHYRDIVPQVERLPPRGISFTDLSVGLTLFSIGLFKKVVLADGIGLQAGQLFRAAAAGENLDLVLAWTAALSYTFQLYFDFSAYSDMATGVARLFGIRLPQNFDSPLKSASMLELWRRWHMTLSRFLRDYIYFPLGGGRQSLARKCFNLSVTFMVSAIWHGAGWTFLVFGVYQSVVVIINVLWSEFRSRLGWVWQGGWWVHCSAVALTFVSWVFGMVVFRADSVATASRLWAGMLGANGAQLPQHWQPTLGPFATFIQTLGIEFASAPRMLQAQHLIWIGALAAITFLLPNVYAITAKFEPVVSVDHKAMPAASGLQWRPNLLWAFVVATMAFLAVVNMSNISEFLYRQF